MDQVLSNFYTESFALIFLGINTDLVLTSNLFNFFALKLWTKADSTIRYEMHYNRSFANMHTHPHQLIHSHHLMYISDHYHCKSLELCKYLYEHFKFCPKIALKNTVLVLINTQLIDYIFTIQCYFEFLLWFFGFVYFGWNGSEMCSMITEWKYDKCRTGIEYLFP